MRKGKGVRMEWIQGCLEGGRQWAGPLETFFCPFQGHAPNFISARTLAFLQQTLGDEKESGREREKLHYLWSPRRLKKKLLSTISGCVKRPFVLRRPPLRNPQTLSPHSSCSLPPPPPLQEASVPHPTPPLRSLQPASPPLPTPICCTCANTQAEAAKHAKFHSGANPRQSCVTARTYQ